MTVGTSTSTPPWSVSVCGSDTSVLHVVWTDNRLGPDKFNVYYTRKVARPSQPWSPNLRISGTSLADGRRLHPGIAAGADNAVALWGAGNLGDPSPVWASRIAPVGCP